MPFDSVKEALEKHPNLKKYSAKARRGWVKAFNNAMESKNDESYAFAVAYSAANKVDDKKNINASIKFSSENEALQYLSDFTGCRIVVAQDVGDLDIDQLIDDIKSMADIPIDDFVERIDDLISVSQEEADARKNLENPTQADLLMAALLQAISKRAQKYRDDLDNMDAEDIDDISGKFENDIQDLVERYHLGQEEVIQQQEAAAEATADISV